MTDLRKGVIAAERPQQCDFCGKIAELRPYGPSGECVCFECGMQNEPAAKAAFLKRLTAPPPRPGRTTERRE